MAWEAVVVVVPASDVLASLLVQETIPNVIELIVVSTKIAVRIKLVLDLKCDNSHQSRTVSTHQVLLAYELCLYIDELGFVGYEVPDKPIGTT
jgi:hypothetical protein